MSPLYGHITELLGIDALVLSLSSGGEFDLKTRQLEEIFVVINFLHVFFDEFINCGQQISASLLLGEASHSPPI